MSDELKNAAAEQENKTEPTISEVVGEVPEKVAAPQEETVGEALNTQPKKEEARVVPEAVFLEIKKENKQLAKDLKELKTSIEAGATNKEVSTDIKALADKYGLDEANVELFQDFAKTVRAQVEQEVEGRLKPLADKERAGKLDDAFNKHFSKAMEQMPEFESIVNKNVIKTLSLDPANANKTFTQLIEETYGRAVPGKRTLDTASIRAGKNDSLDVDVAKAQKDPEYFKEVLANPILKKKYNDSLIGRISSQL